jgi:hypothetical protein
MSDPPETQHVEIKDGDQTVAAAKVSTSDDSETARASLHAAPGQIGPGRRTRWRTGRRTSWRAGARTSPKTGRRPTSSPADGAAARPEFRPAGSAS